MHGSNTRQFPPGKKGVMDPAILLPMLQETAPRKKGQEFSRLPSDVNGTEKTTRLTRTDRLVNARYLLEMGQEKRGILQDLTLSSAFVSANKSEANTFDFEDSACYDHSQTAAIHSILACCCLG